MTSDYPNIGDVGQEKQTGATFLPAPVYFGLP